MFYEVIEVTENAWGYDEINRGKFDLFSEAMEFIENNYDENCEDVYISDSYGEVVWG